MTLDAFEQLDRMPDDLHAKAKLAQLFKLRPDAAPLDRIETLHRLVIDPAVDPSPFANATWLLLDRLNRIPAITSPSAIADWIEHCILAQDLLIHTPVTRLEAELPLTAARRWLLLEGKWKQYPMAVSALRQQAAHNGGAWPFDEQERARIDIGVPDEIALTYLPQSQSPISVSSLDGATALTQSVAAQYSRWPYPVWSRAMLTEQSSLSRLAERIDPDGPLVNHSPSTVLIAGCGTGWEVAVWAQQYPDARILAIDISHISLAYAEARCRELKLDNVEFKLLDLHRLADLEQKFDVIVCSGVLHHLDTPEAGLAALTDCLATGGIMRIMVYSRVARLAIHGLRERLSYLRAKPVNDDVLREARAVLIAQYPHFLRKHDYFTLGGIHDLLFNVQEDPFDILRIKHAVAALDLVFLSFMLPANFPRKKYLSRYPDDVLQRDFSNWQQIEQDDPLLFQGMYGFWCRKV